MIKKKRELNDWLIIFSLIALVIIFIRQFILYNVPEIVPFGEELGELLYDSCVGYLVTYWFYYLTVYVREKNYKKKVYKFVTKNVNSIIIDYDLLLEKIKNVKNNNPALKEIELDNAHNFSSVLIFIYPREMSGVLNGAFQEMSWGELFKLKRDNIERSLKDIFMFIPYLDSEDIELFTNMYKSNFLEHIRNLNLNRFDDLQFLGQQMWEFGEMIKILEGKFPQNT